jgi:hypothetical protein
MLNRIRITKYIIAVLIGAFFAVFFSLVDKTYAGIKEAENKVLSPVPVKALDPKIDSSFLDVLESQYNFTTPPEKIVATPTPAQP